LVVWLLESPRCALGPSGLAPEAAKGEGKGGEAEEGKEGNAKGEHYAR